LLRARLERVDAPAPLDGLRRGGYRLTFTEAASDFFESAEKKAQAHRPAFFDRPGHR